MTRLALLVLLASAACGGSPPPPTRYYQLATPAAASAPAAAAAAVSLVVEPLSAAGAYDDERMVYRSSPYRLDYYDYHRWTSPPGTMIAGYLAQALRRTGRFHAIATDAGDDDALVLGGRVVAIEEVDTSGSQWTGRIALELVLRDHGGNTLWSMQLDETVPMPVQSPEGLAQAITEAMARIVTRVAPELGRLAERQAHARTRAVWRDSTSRQP